MAVRFGYRASAEGFGPVQLAGFAAGADQAAFIERYGREILPRLRGR